MLVFFQHFTAADWFFLLLGLAGLQTLAMLGASRLVRRNLPEGYAYPEEDTLVTTRPVLVIRGDLLLGPGDEDDEQVPDAARSVSGVYAKVERQDRGVA